MRRLIGIARRRIASLFTAGDGACCVRALGEGRLRYGTGENGCESESPHHRDGVSFFGVVLETCEGRIGSANKRARVMVKIRNWLPPVIGGSAERLAGEQPVQSTVRAKIVSISFAPLSPL